MLLFRAEGSGVEDSDEFSEIVLFTSLVTINEEGGDAKRTGPGVASIAIGSVRIGGGVVLFDLYGSVDAGTNGNSSGPPFRGRSDDVSDI
jgi:hypothetical protein